MNAQFEYDATDSLWLRYKHSDGRDLAVWLGGFGFTNETAFEEHPRYKEFQGLVQDLAKKVFNE